MDEVAIKSITHHSNRVPPLTVVFLADGKEHSIDLDAGQIQTFGAFQRVVANRLGVWLRFAEGERRNRAAESWQDEVDAAFVRK
jgi:altronate dehydratase